MTSNFAKSATCFSISAVHPSKAAFLSEMVVFDQDLNAVLAAATASSTSCGADTGTSQLGFLVAGLMACVVLDAVDIFPLITLEKVVKSILEPFAAEESAEGAMVLEAILSSNCALEKE